jgi:UDP-glucose 4-epimerase
MDRLDEIVNRYNITSCIHFAGSTSVPESVANPSLYYKNNLIMTISLLDKLIECGVKTFVYSSSAATYGDPGMQLCMETDVPNPISSYGASKLMIEQVCRDYKDSIWTFQCGTEILQRRGCRPRSGDVGELREK